MSRSISVVVPARSAAPWIGETLESILAQDIEDCEVLVIDNGSTDDTADVVAAFTAQDPRVRLVRSAASTAAGARNAGVAVASKEYLVFADADDVVPDGAYRAMLDSLESSGSDMAIGDHLKFSPTSTWSPTGRWLSFDEPRVALRPEDLPALLSGRACWNRVFRRSFWDDAGLAFPDVPSLEDIVPMTRAFVRAARIDLVPETVYLYRDRADTGSVSNRADAATTRRYFEQEAECAALVAGRPVLRTQHAEIVLDADGWAHLARFLDSKPTVDEIASVLTTVGELLRVVPFDDVIESVAPVRRMLWALVLIGDHVTASDFVTGAVSDDAPVRLGAWRDAVSSLMRADRVPLDASRLTEEGFVPVLVNGADEVTVGWIASTIRGLEQVTFAGTEPGLRRAMTRAVTRRDAGGVADVARLRRVVPLVVQRADPTAAGLEVAGTLPSAGVVPRLELVFRSDDESVAVPIRSSAGAWSAVVDAQVFRVGRWTVVARADGVDEDFPVITARMPLPPVPAQLPIQPLADRADGWRFLVDRRPPPRSALRKVLGRIRRDHG